MIEGEKNVKRLTRYAGLIAGASLLTAGLGGCSYGDNEGSVLLAAQEGCKDHGGVHTLYLDAWQRHAKCNDGMRAMNLRKSLQ